MAGSVTQTKTYHKSRGIVRIDATVTTDASGNATATNIGGPVYGRLVCILTNAGLDAGAHVTVYVDGVAVITTTADFTGGGVGSHVGGFVRPMTVVTATPLGVGLVDGVTSINNARDMIVAGQLSIGVSAGGNALTGKYSFIVDEEFTGGTSADL